MKHSFFLIAFLWAILCAYAQDKVMICKSSNAYAYHKSMCRGLRECNHPIEKVTIPEAVKLKRTPCGYCYDGKNEPSGSIPTEAQCKGITKKGTRCSRTGKYNGYCYQHST